MTHLSIPTTCARPSLLALALALVAAGCAGPDPSFNDAGWDFGVAPDMLSCLPNNDGVIEQKELLFVLGLPPANYRANPPGTTVGINPSGQMVDGKLEWDFSSLAGQIVQLKVEPVAGTWYAKHFPLGDMAMVTSVKGDTLQVLNIDSNKVFLLGLASRKPEDTLTIYDPPISAMRFPLRKGIKFTATSSLKAGSKINGLPITTKDTYEVSINTEGVLRLPNLKLHRVLLIETLVTSKTLGGVTNTTRQLQWFSECYGEVVRALSNINEKDALFKTASELRRLAL